MNLHFTVTPDILSDLLEKYPQGDNELALYQALANSG